jgi:broad specificity phosphatase PhoE
LTVEGRRECEEFSNEFSYGKYITEIFCSPMTRAIETTLLCFAYLGIPIKVFPHLQPLHLHNSGIGLDPDKLKTKFKEARNLDILDLSLVEKGWNSKRGKWNPDRYKRVMKKFELWLSPEKGKAQEIVIIGHTSWIKEFLKRHGILLTLALSDTY